MKRMFLELVVVIGVAAGLALLVWRMHRLSLRGQFLVLLAIGVTIGFLFLTAVQVPSFPLWLAVLLVVVVLIESPFAVRTFMRSLKQEEDEHGRGDGAPDRRP